MNTNICILDYGSGNVRSVFNMVSLLDSNVIISNEPEVILSASHLILPGVGAFEASMKKIQQNIPLKVLHSEVFKKKKPFLGICVGMQVLAEKGFEFGESPGLGWVKGEVRKLTTGALPLPHVGWNNIQIKNTHPLIKDATSDFDFYFVHSFALFPADQERVLATTHYGEDFCSIVVQDNIYGVQFHPEKSQQAGQTLIKNFLQL